jgi:hypothetical protein
MCLLGRNLNIHTMPKKSHVSKRYKWHFKASTTRLLEVCQPNLKLPSTAKSIKAYFEANH